MDCTKPAKNAPVTCPCGAEVPQVPGPGRVKKYCKPSCGRSWRQRMAALGFPV
ncbi:hypothetical protein ABZY83_17010 [Streptomyces virginiae]|uniref:hypothetical protein n=1 Tax=Streptomyces virginiae TaxID=1961 RepID=UPI0033AE1CC4